VLDDCVGEEETWLLDVLGYRRLQLSAEMEGRARWFGADDGTEIHLSIDPLHQGAAAAHVALVVDDLEDLARRLDARGDEYRKSSRPDRDVIICRDPASNLWELRSA
jgi:hypothetical protein